MNHALQNEEPVELWHVEVAPNDVRVVTLEKLDEAFQKGLVNERTRVFQDGMSEPAFLGELLGLADDDDVEDEPEMQAAPPVSTIGPSRHYQETLIGLTATPSTVPQRSAPPPQSRPPAWQAHPSRQPAPQAVPARSPAYAASAYPPVVQAAPAARRQSVAPQAAQTRRPPPPPEGAWPPVVARQAPHQTAQVPRSVVPPAPAVLPSVVPLAMDLGDDLDFPQPKRRGKVVFLGAGVLAVAAGVALAVTGQGQSLLSSLTASAPPPAPVKAAAPPPVFKSHALDVGEAPVKLKDAPAPVVITTCENEAQMLGAAASTASTKEDVPAKSSPSKAAPTRSVGAHRAKSGGGAPRGGGGGGGAHSPKAPNMTGGSKYDPLNGSL